METILTQTQQDLLKHTREVLGTLRDTLAAAEPQAEERKALTDSIRQLDELFLLVVAGEFNAGKSSFLNALLGHPLLAEGVTPTTSQIHHIKYGIDSQQTPRGKGVWEQTAPVEFLKQINIVDTPGTNAILREHEALTAEFIPRSDLVLFITSVDRPFAESERQFLEQIRDWGKKIILIINKKDMLDNEKELIQVVDFVSQAARNLLQTVPPIFAISAKQAQLAKFGQPELWLESGFEAVEQYIHDTLDDEGRFRLKLLNPLGVGQRLNQKQLRLVNEDLASLQDDTILLDDIQGQMTYYNGDMRRNFEGRLGEVNNLLFEMEARGRDFFDQNLRLARIPDLLRKERLKVEFETDVVQDTPDLIERRVSELVDWMVEQDLRQWTAVADHLNQRNEVNASRIVGQGGPKEGTLAYDRGRLVDSIGEATRRAVRSFDKQKEAAGLADMAREAVIRTGGAFAGAGLGTALAFATTAAMFDVTGVVATVAGIALGLLVLPMRKRKAKEEMAAKLKDLRERLVANLTEQFEREMRRSSQRIEDTVAPFARFVRSEQDKLQKQQVQLDAVAGEIAGIKSQLG